MGSRDLVPWLAAEGPLAYSPAEPPLKDYFFQYSWILPGIFNPAINLRRHYYFGSYLAGTTQIFSSTSGGTPARDTELRGNFTANSDWFRTSKSRRLSPLTTMSGDRTTLRGRC
jgi:hypothetical protein